MRGTLVDKKNAGHEHYLTNFESNNFLTSIDPEELRNDFQFQITGYAGSEENHAVTSTGPRMEVKETDQGGWIIKYDVATESGMGGSAIQVTDKSWIDEKKVSQ